MRNYIFWFAKKYQYPENATNEILSLYDALEYNETFNNLLTKFYDDISIDVDYEDSLLSALCKDAGISFYTAKLLFYICLSKSLKEQYLKKGYSESLWADNMEDIKWKMNECYENRGVWGIFSVGWFSLMFRMEIFTFGRLNYNIVKYQGEDFTLAGRTIKEGDICINVHVPSSGKPFDKDTRMQSYVKAYSFFSKEFGIKEPLFRCESWLLYPPNKEILPEKSNIVSFMNDFKIISSYEFESSTPMWRIFGTRCSLPAKELPRDSSLQRAYADYFEKGNNPGAGTGFFLLDTVNKKTLH